MRLHIRTIAITGLLLVTATASPQVRRWTDNTGSFSVEAELAEVKGENIILRKSDGAVISAPISRLSTADQQYLKSLDEPTSPPLKGKLVWTTNLAEMRAPDAPISGTLHGQSFSPEKVTLQGNTLTLTEGDDFSPEKEITIFMFHNVDESVSDKAFRISPNDGFGGPHVHARWKVEGRGQSETKMFMNQYAMLLTFGKSQAGHVSGRIYLCLPDESKSVVAGAFSVEVFDETHPDVTQTEICGEVMLRGRHSDLQVTVDCMGFNPEGKLESPGIGLKLDGKSQSVTDLSCEPRNSTVSWDEQAGHGSHLHVSRQPGHYLVGIRGRQKSAQHGVSRCEGYFDWKWVELKDDASKVKVDLVIDPDNTGSVEVSVSAPLAFHPVSYLPLDDDGRIPLPEAKCHEYADAIKLHDGKAVVTWLRPGNYQFATGRWTGTGRTGYFLTAKATVEVQRGARTKVHLTSE